MFLNEKGLGLTEVLLGAGLLGGLALVGTQLSSNLNRGVKNAETNADIIPLVQSIRQTLSKPENCTATFLGKNPKNEENAAAALKDNSVDAFITKTVNPSLSYGQNLKISSYKLSDAGDEVEVDTLKTTNLIIEFDKGKSGFMQSSSKKIPLKVELDGSGKITSCIAMSNSSDSIWKHSDNNVDIYFNEGNAGIGTDTPSVKLDVAGEIRALGVTVDAPCTAAGSLGHDSATKAPVFCNGTNWKALTSVLAGVMCPSGKFLRGFDVNGTAVCESPAGGPPSSPPPVAAAPTPERNCRTERTDCTGTLMLKPDGGWQCVGGGPGDFVVCD